MVTLTPAHPLYANEAQRRLSSTPFVRHTLTPHLSKRLKESDAKIINYFKKGR